MQFKTGDESEIAFRDAAGRNRRGEGAERTTCEFRDGQ